MKGDVRVYIKHLPDEFHLRRLEFPNGFGKGNRSIDRTKPLYDGHKHNERGECRHYEGHIEPPYPEKSEGATGVHPRQPPCRQTQSQHLPDRIRHKQGAGMLFYEHGRIGKQRIRRNPLQQEKHHYGKGADYHLKKDKGRDQSGKGRPQRRKGAAFKPSVERNRPRRIRRGARLPGRCVRKKMLSRLIHGSYRWNENSVKRVRLLRKGNLAPANRYLWRNECSRP